MKIHLKTIKSLPLEQGLWRTRLRSMGSTIITATVVVMPKSENEVENRIHHCSVNIIPNRLVSGLIRLDCWPFSGLSLALSYFCWNVD